MGLFKAVKRVILGKGSESKSASSDADKLINSLKKARSALNIRMKKLKAAHFFLVNHIEYRESFDALFDFIAKNPIEHCDLLRARSSILQTIFSIDIGDMGMDAAILNKRLDTIRANAPPSFNCYLITGPTYLSKCLPNNTHCKCASEESVCFRRQAKSRTEHQKILVPAPLNIMMNVNTNTTPTAVAVTTTTTNTTTTPSGKLPPPITPAMRMRMRSMSQTCFNFDHPPTTNNENEPSSPRKRASTLQSTPFSPKSPKLGARAYAAEKTAQMAPGTELHRSISLITKSIQESGFTSPLRKRSNAVDNVPTDVSSHQDLAKPEQKQPISMGGFEFPMGGFEFPTPTTRRQSTSNINDGLYFKVDKSIHANNPFLSPAKRQFA